MKSIVTAVAVSWITCSFCFGEELNVTNNLKAEAALLEKNSELLVANAEILNLRSQIATLQEYQINTVGEILSAGLSPSHSESGISPLTAFSKSFPLGSSKDYIAYRSEVIEAFPLLKSIWRNTRIQVSWESPDEEYTQEKEWVKKSIEDSWASVSGLEFYGWTQASNNTKGIRILISDETPHVKHLGNRLDGIPNGMVLNFDFRMWCPQCKLFNSREDSIKWLAVHEFGHALGYSHEHNRPDRDSNCAMDKQGPDGDLLLTPYDPNSVMNYCNPRWNNFGVLSNWDIWATQNLYGKPNVIPNLIENE